MIFAQGFPNPGKLMPMGSWADGELIDVSVFPAFQYRRYRERQDSTSWTPGKDK